MRISFVSAFYLTLGLLLASASGFAAFLPTESNTWEEIENDYYFRLKIGFPVIALDNGPAVSANHLCLDGQKLRTKRPMKKCVRYGMPRRGQRECLQYGEYYGEASLSGWSSVCVQWRNLGRGERECLRYEDRPYRLELNWDVPVYHKIPRGGAEFDYKLLFKKNYSVERC